jgi:hypothetical protein
VLHVAQPSGLSCAPARQGLKPCATGRGSGDTSEWGLRWRLRRSRSRSSGVACSRPVPGRPLWARRPCRKCHRRLLALALLAQGVPVRISVGAAEPKPYTLSDFARIREDKVIDPASCTLQVSTALPSHHSPCIGLIPGAASFSSATGTKTAARMSNPVDGVRIASRTGETGGAVWQVLQGMGRRAP